jgi:GcrA cell cycle regulator
LGISGREPPTRPHAAVGRPARPRASAGGTRRPTAPPAQRRLATIPRTPFEAPATATIHTLTAHGCRWPIGEPDEAGFGFCGRLRTGPGSYCAGHAPMAVRRRDTPLKAKEIDRMVGRFAGGGHRESGDFSIREVI